MLCWHGIMELLDAGAIVGCGMFIYLMSDCCLARKKYFNEFSFT